MKRPPTIIDSGEALKNLVSRVRSCDRVALDTEFVWERTYYPRLGLIQVGLSMEECYLVDVPALGDLNALGDLLETPTVQLVLHDAPQDLSILRRVTGAYPRTVFDTRCAAGFAGLSSTMSLSDLIEELLDVNLSKAASRTNWLQRPLSAAQLDYAAADVRYLIAASERLVQRASERNSEGWMAEEMRAYDQPSLYEERDEREQYTRLKGYSPSCQPRELAVLRELAAWREREARRLDRPRSHIVGDRTLVHLARCKPTTLEDLKGFHGLSERKIHQCGAELVAAAVAGLRAKNCPTLPPRPPDPRARKRHIDALLDYVRRRGADVGIDPQLVTSRAELRDLFSGGEQAVTRRIMGGWRKEFMGDLSAVGGGAALGLGAA